MTRQWTEREPSFASSFPIGATRNMELPGTEDEGGQPLVVKIRRLPTLEVLDVKLDGDLQQQNDEMRRVARRGIVAPKLSFDAGDPPPYWDDLPLSAQLSIVVAIAEFTAEGMKEVKQALESFRPDEEGGAEDGTAGARPDPAGRAANAAARVAGASA